MSVLNDTHFCELSVFQHSFNIHSNAFWLSFERIHWNRLQHSITFFSLLKSLFIFHSFFFFLLLSFQRILVGCSKEHISTPHCEPKKRLTLNNRKKYAINKRTPSIREHQDRIKAIRVNMH